MTDQTADPEAVERFIQNTLKEHVISEGLPRTSIDTQDAYETVELLRALLAAKEKAEAEYREFERSVVEREEDFARKIGKQEARAEAAEAERDEARRRRDEWRKKAEGYDEVRRALREKIGEPWPPNMSRLLWAGIAADEKKRADDAEAEAAALRERLEAAREGLETAQAQAQGTPHQPFCAMVISTCADTLATLDQPKEGEDNDG